MVRIGVLLPAEFQRGGELLADVRALDDAGAYAVLVDGSEPASLVLLAAVAAVTHRVKVVCVRGPVFPRAAFAMLDRISGGRALVFARGTPPERLSDPDLRPEEAWMEIEMPADRPAWRQAIAAQEAAGAAGMVVPWDPRLVDLLRNPDADDDRSDLQMSTG